ncbi:MAG: DUF4131 domain-containing protein [Clostridia bacterium]|nr:DUF4131 domain-containing protein [Clostridia bacterium]
MKKQIKLMMITVLIVFTIRLANAIYTYHFKYENEEGYSRKNCMIIQLQKVSDEKITYLVEYNHNKFLLNLYGKKEETIDFERYGKFQYGDVISCRGKITIPQKLGNPYEFDYKLYLNSLGISRYHK